MNFDRVGNKLPTLPDWRGGEGGRHQIVGMSERLWGEGKEGIELGLTGEGGASTIRRQVTHPRRQRVADPTWLKAEEAASEYSGASLIMNTHHKYLHTYAILRIDGFQNEDVSIEDMVRIKKIVWDESFAESEVDRLNAMNSTKGCRYYWRVARLEKPSNIQE